MKIHTIVGAQILERVGFPYPVVPIVRHHHERWDGRGYPDGLAAEQIPMTARILTVVDCFDAVREDRQYRKGMTREEACQLLRDGASKQFDPGVVEAFLENLPIYEAEIAAHKEAQQPLLTPTTQAGLSEGARAAVPAAGLAQPASESPEYVKQISAAHAEIAALYEMAQNVSTKMSVRDAVTLAVSHIERMIPFTTCVFYLRQGDDSALAAHVFGQNAESISGRSLATGRGIVGWVLINGQPMSNTDPMLDLGDFLGTNDTGYRTAAVYPLVDGDKIIGGLALYTTELDAYSSSHLHLLESMARFTSTALHRAMLYEQTEARAHLDATTGLPNRRGLYSQLEREIDTAKGQGRSLQVLSLHITGLRAVNQAYGYQVGDQMLTEAANRLRQVVDRPHMVSRLAGGEFICVLSGYGRADALRLAERARAEVSSFALEVGPNESARVGLRFGAAEYPTQGQTIDELLREAAMPSEVMHHYAGPPAETGELVVALPPRPAEAELVPVNA